MRGVTGTAGRRAAGGAPAALALACALLLVPAVGGDPARAQEPDPAPGGTVAAVPAAVADPGAVVVTVARGPSGLEVEGRCAVRAPAAVVWEVLTDYDRIDEFVSSMRESRVAGRGEHHVLVEQVAVGRLFLFSRRFRATLFVEEAPPDLIRFEDVLGKDFESYRGEWRIEERAGAVGIHYRVAARPSFSVPNAIAKGLFRRTVGDLLAEVKSEIERRAAAAVPAAAPADTVADPAAR